jgi:hypothetical protein
VRGGHGTNALFGEGNPPVAANDSFTVQSGVANATLAVLGNDSFAPDYQEILQITRAGAASNGGTVVIASGNLTLRYTPASGFTGTETFTYTITDGGPNSTATATVTMTVQA